MFFFVSKSESELLYNCRSVSQSVSESVLALSPSGTQDKVLAVVKTVEVLFVVGRPP
jgi:hypothetical protein